MEKKKIDHIALKVSKIIGIMYRLKFTPPADVLLTIYNSLILPHFNYCHLAWGSNITAGHKLHLLQKKTVRIVDHRHFLAHTEPICKGLRIVKIVDMFQISIWKFYYKLMNMLPSYSEYMSLSSLFHVTIMEFVNLDCILPSLTMSLENRWFNIV